MNVQIGDRKVEVQRSHDDHLVLWVDGRRVIAAVTRDGSRTWVTVGGRTLALSEAKKGKARDDGGGSLEAPMPGKVVKVLVEVGDVVERGQPLLTVEAMKMEHALKSPRRAIVKALRAQAGDQVVPGRALVELGEVEDTT